MIQQNALNQNLNQTINQAMQQEPTMPNPYSFMSDSELKEIYGFMTQDLASDPNLENDGQFMMELEFAEDEMSARGFLNSNGMQGAPSFFGLGLTNQQSAIIDQVSGQLIKASEMHRGQAERLRNLGTLSGSSTSTSSTSAHGDMRMHVARMYQADPRADLYEY